MRTEHRKSVLQSYVLSARPTKTPLLISNSQHIKLSHLAWDLIRDGLWAHPLLEDGVMPSAVKISACEGLY